VREGKVIWSLGKKHKRWGFRIKHDYVREGRVQATKKTVDEHFSDFVLERGRFTLSDALGFGKGTVAVRSGFGSGAH